MVEEDDVLEEMAKCWEEFSRERGKSRTLSSGEGGQGAWRSVCVSK